MIHPLFHLISTRPHLLVEHVGAYGELAGEEVARLTASWRKRAILAAAGAFAITIAAVLAGVAAMLWAVVPNAVDQARWVLVGVPLAPAVLGFLCLLGARGTMQRGAFDTLREQLGADMAMLRSVSAVPQ